MIEILKIKNFKSIKDLELRCSKINLFIGEPNAGKSNLLEALGLLSYTAYGDKYHLKNFVRFETMNNLFFDDDVERSIEVSLQCGPEIKILKLFLIPAGLFRGTLTYLNHAKNAKFEGKLFDCDYNAKGQFAIQPQFKPIKFYRFKKQHVFPDRFSVHLLSPNGHNLLSILISHKNIKNIISDFLRPFGYKLMFKPQENKIEIVKQYDDILISIPYALISDTFQRLIFYLTAILSNKNSILVFEEPESHTFPYYTKFLAETIALDNKNNQFFISTHNPYFLFSVLEKSKKDDIAVFVVYMENFETKARKLTQQEIEEAMNIGLDFFFNLDRFRNKQQG